MVKRGGQAMQKQRRHEMQWGNGSHRCWRLIVISYAIEPCRMG
jgi:hypothetical protein